MLRIGIFTPRTGGVAVISIIGRGISAGAAGCRSAMLAVRIIAPRSIAQTGAGIIIVCRAAVSAGTCAPMLTGRILLPRAIAIAVTAGIDGFALGLATSTAIITVSITGASCGLLTL